MKIVFDMDNTLADELGKELRPGVLELLKRLEAEGHELALWTSSTRQRALRILKDLGLREFFIEKRYREDYDPKNEGKGKDIREIGGDILIDDDPKQVRFAEKIGCRGLAITAYRGGDDPNPGEMTTLYNAIHKRGGLFGFIKR